MAVDLPHPGDILLPAVPAKLRQDNPELYEYLQAMNRTIIDLSRGLFSNDSMTVSAMNSGTSGTFTLSSGGSIIVTSGIVITVTS